MPFAKNKTSPRKVKAAERRKLAVEMRTAGKPLRVIAKELSISVSAAHQAITRALAETTEITNKEAERLRAISCERLDKSLAAIWPQALRGKLGAVDRVVTIELARHRILGTAAPQQIDVNNATVVAVTVEQARERVIKRIEETVSQRLAEKVQEGESE